VDRLANGVTHITKTRFVDRFSNRRTNFPITFFVTGDVDSVADIAITGPIDRLANCVAFLAVTGFVDISGTGIRNPFAYRVVNRFVACDLLLFPDCLLDVLITDLRCDGAISFGHA